jgi:spermidine synthase
LSRQQLRIVLLCFFLSGIAGLIYEVAWTKALGLVFGHSVYAIATVLAAFMAGLAAGSAYIGRWGDRHTQPLRLYAWIEIFVAATAALSLLGLDAVRVLYVAAYHSVSSSMPLLEALRFAGSVLVLFVPTFLMGGTLPVLVAAVTRSSSEMSMRLGRLYWVNTTGAVVGALAAGFLLLPWVGLRLTVGTAVLCNLLAGSLALTCARRLTGPRPESPVKEAAHGSASSVVRTPTFLLVAFAVVGATSMAYEISWTRLLSTTLGSSTYAFTIMLATFLAGIALGSRLFEARAARSKVVSVATFAKTQIYIGLGGMIFLPLYGRMPAFAWWMVSATHKEFSGLLLTQFVVCGLAMLPAALVFGFNFPAVTALISGVEKLESTHSAGVGRACAANTLGAILGSVATGFWLVPWLGSFRVVAFTAAVNLLLAVYLLTRHTPRRASELVGSLALALIAALAGWTGFLYDPALANFSIANHPEANPPHISAYQLAHSTDLLYSEDGFNASIAVTRGEDIVALKTNGKTDASTVDIISQLMLGHLGEVFGKSPRRVLVIGFGSGMTVSAVARYPDVERIDCVEIEPAVLHATPYLQSLNRGVLADPRVHIIVDDARNFLFTARDQYDLIISEPSNPWIAGIASLFTDEFYAQARTRLAPGGMLLQWVQGYSLFSQDVKMILATLSPHFAQVSVWRGAQGDFLILAQTDRSQLNFDRMRRLWELPGLRVDYDMLGLTRPEGLIAYHLLDDADLRGLVAAAPLNTDDRTRLEYRAPLAIFAGNTAGDNLRMFTQASSSLLPASISLSGNHDALVAAAQTSLFLRDTERAGAYISAVAADPPAEQSELLRANWLFATRDFAGARAAFISAEELNPSSIAARMGLATVALQEKNYDSSEQILHDVLNRLPGYPPALEIFALAEAGRENWKGALAWQVQRVRSDPSRAFEDLLFLADLLVRNGDNQNAENLYIEILSRDPYNGPARVGLGKLYLTERKWDDARVQFEVLIHYFPDSSPDAYVSLSRIYRKMGRLQDAEYCLRQGQRAFPSDASLLRSQSAD